MILQLVLFFAIGSAATTAVAMMPGTIRARAWAGIPLGLLALVVAGWVTSAITEDSTAMILVLLGLGAAVEARRHLPAWSMLGAQLLACVVLGSLSYLVYAGIQPFADGFGPVGIIGSFVLLLLEAAALSLSIYYLFEILDVLSRRDQATHQADAAYLPRVALQVPAYNEPVEIMRETLGALAKLDYPDLIVQVVDNNTKDPEVWKPLEALCRELGPRFQFLHLDPWPGYKAGALNEATRRLPDEVEVLGIVDADYLVKPGFLRAVVGHFKDPQVAFVQTPQHYRDWQDDKYLRGLFFSYRYFFDITMPARAHRNAIIFAGTMGLIRRSALAEIGGWNEACITEDAEASLRMLGRGSVGVYERRVFGEGLMPLTFDGLKKQRFRWALGGIQILRMHWRELAPIGRRQLRLHAGQRIHYLLGSMHWFGDVLTTSFTLLLLLTAAAAALHHRLPVRELTGPVVVVPLAFLLTGVLRALWAMRTAVRCTWGDGIRAMAVWFALSWVDTLAVVRGLASNRAAFLRTPKRKEGGSHLWPALRSSSMETMLALLAVAAAIIMLVRAPGFATAILAFLLLFEAAIFGAAPWASLAAEGIQLTPFRQVYRRSPQNTGERPVSVRNAAAVPVALAAGAAVALGIMLLNVMPAPVSNNAPADLPKLGNVAQNAKTAAPSVAPSATPSASPSASPSPSPSVSPSSSATALPSPT